MIDAKSGEIKFDDFVLKPHMQLDSLINKLSREEILSIDEGKGANIYLKPQKGGCVYLVVRAFFENEGIGLFNLQIKVQNNALVPSWKDWSEAQQLQIKSINDDWLKSELGNPPYEFNWGSLRSVYNARDGSSYIVVSYK